MEYPTARNILQPAIRIFEATQWMSMKELSARCGFWGLSKSSVARFTKYLGFPIDCSGSIFDVTPSAAREILGGSDDDALDACHRRLLGMRRDATFSSEVVQIDAAIQTFDINDQDEVARQCTSADKRVNENEAYSEDYVAAKSEFDRRKQRRTVPKKYPDLPSTIPQEYARKFCPPGAHIWRALGRCEWAGHTSKDHIRVSARWCDHGEDSSMRVVLRKMWNQWNEQHGKDHNTSPIKGLFPDEGSAAAGSNGS